MSTVYVFGAGASIHAGYPLASKMGEGLLEFMLNYEFPNDNFRSSAQNMIEIFGTTPNIEDLVSELEIKLDSLQNAESYDDRVMGIIFRDCLTHISQMLREWFRVLHNHPAHLYAAFADRIIKP